MPIRRIQNIYVVAHDMERMAGFYGQALGAVLKFRDGDAWTQFGLGGGNFALASPAEAGAGDKGATVTFEADDPDAVAAAVEQAGGRILDRRNMGGHGRTVTCADPEGNVFQLFARAATGGAAAGGAAAGGADIGAGTTVG
ncbi:VOC family protein [Niveispirillum fermenti]|uniref:VOC family protein n=1 Tax=Niveispirillum fermenti TaxID=1233113 RepID=UPI003A84F5AC